MDFDTFQIALNIVAEKKHVELSAVQHAVAELHGPVLHATKADAVRFHDDKSAYTGTHASSTLSLAELNAIHHLRPHAETVSKGSVTPIPVHHTRAASTEREHRNHVRRASLPATVLENSMLLLSDAVEETFTMFCGDHQEMDGKSFAKLCKDCQLVSGKFSLVDADLIFAKVASTSHRRLDLQHFKSALALVAEKKGVALAVVWECVAESAGPVMRATKTDPVRFHDHKSTYTGMHAQHLNDVVKASKSDGSSAAVNSSANDGGVDDGADDGAESVPVGTGLRAVRKMRKAHSTHSESDAEGSENGAVVSAQSSEKA